MDLLCDPTYGGQVLNSPLLFVLSLPLLGLGCHPQQASSQSTAAPVVVPVVVPAGSPENDPVPAYGQAPDVQVQSSEGDAVALSSLWQAQGVYLVFYRGSW